ncbi:MAG TPA: IS1595 family transposase [Terriglobales bacterium]|nr:IS1595 family transposase [Terriglobales bacterium]
MKTKKHILSNSEIIRDIPRACSDEVAAVEFLEKQRWGNSPACVKCGSVNVYKMTDAKTGERNSRFLWRCHDCKEQYTVRIGTIYEESRIPLRHWCYAFWRAATSKKGVSALELKRQCQISYRSALFLMNRIRFAMAPDSDSPRLKGIVEADEMYVGARRPRYPGISPKGRGTTNKVPVFCAVERGGQLRRRVIPDVTGHTLRSALHEEVDRQARLITDEYPRYKAIGRDFASHGTVCHSTKEYVRGDIHTNTVESTHALVKRGIVGIYHNVSREYLHRYLWQFDFMWNHREMNDGERTIAAIQAAEGKRLMYREPIEQQREYTKNREQEGNQQVEPF